jgi:hypothetical protein
MRIEHTDASKFGQVEILKPTADPSMDPGIRLAQRLPSLRGRSIGIANNLWNCMNVITTEYAQVLLGEYGVREVIEKQSASTARLPKAMMDDLVKRCDAVIVGIGN